MKQTVRWRVYSSLFSLVIVACGDKEEERSDTGACISVQTDCTPLYEPTWENVYAQTLQPSCGAGVTSCHSADGAKGGLVLDDSDSAWMGLIDAGRVVPEEPGCSLLVQRLESEDGAEQMPPGDRLSEEERCAVRLWIDNGAEP